MKNSRFKRFLIVLSAFLMISGELIGAVPVYAAGSFGGTTLFSPVKNEQYIELDCTELTMKVGESYTFGVYGKTNDGLAYTSYDTEYFREEEEGFTFTALKAGTSVIEFSSTDDTVKTSCRVTILEAEDTRNTMRATIDGEEHIFYLESAHITGSNIYVYYKALNPRGEDLYTISFSFYKNLTEGRYFEPNVTFRKAGLYSTYYSSKTRGRTVSGNDHFTIESVSEDWTTYDGCFNAAVAAYSRGSAVMIENAVFNFTLDECHENFSCTQ